MLPHLHGRPLMLERHPEGVDGKSFKRRTHRTTFPTVWTPPSCPRRTAPSLTCSATTPPLSRTSPARPVSPRTLAREGRSEAGPARAAPPGRTAQRLCPDHGRPIRRRALPGAPVAPLAWSELNEPGLAALADSG
uniref:hypothetical protein n=1 Tax=Streptomyces violascens TaxID=67381 RepID=UPI0035711686